MSRNPPPLCALAGCDKPVPKVALLHGDLFCSSGCFRVAHGLKDASEEARDKVASASCRRAAAAVVGGWMDQGHHSWEAAQKVKAR